MNRVIQLNWNPQGDTFNVSATETSVATAIGAAMGPDSSLMIYNSSLSSIAFVALGDSTVTASASTSVPVPPGFQFPVFVGSEFTHVAVVCDTDETAIVYFSPGIGSF